MALLKVRVVECAHGHTEHVGLTGVVETLTLREGQSTYVRLDADQQGNQAVCDASKFDPLVKVTFNSDTGRNYDYEVKP